MLQRLIRQLRQGKAKAAETPGRETILICDDDYGVREAYKLILSDQYNLQLVANGSEAVRVLRRRPAKVMILDLKMPEMDGLEVLRRVKQVSPATHVIISTGYRSVETAQEAARLGCHDYLIKPFIPQDVLSAVQQGLAKAAAGPR